MSRPHSSAQDVQRAQQVPGHGPVAAPVFLCRACGSGLTNGHPGHERCRVCGAQEWGKY